MKFRFFFVCVFENVTRRKVGKEDNASAERMVDLGLGLIWIIKFK